MPVNINGANFDEILGLRYTVSQEKAERQQQEIIRSLEQEGDVRFRVQTHLDYTFTDVARAFTD